MKLKKLLGISNEVGETLTKYSDIYKIILVNDRDGLQAYLTNILGEKCVQDDKEKKGNNSLADILLITATDETIALGKQYGIATMAYMNLDIPNQTYSGVDMIVEGFEEVDVNFLEKVWQRYHGMPWKIAETSRCIIRELSLDDLDALFEIYADEEIYKYTENLYAYEEEKEFQDAYINKMYRFYGYGMWLVFSKETGELIGRVGLEHREYDEEIELELGYLIGTKYQGKGYATEVCQAVLRIAKEMTDFQRINCLIDADNIASIRLAIKLHFSHAEDAIIDGKKMSRYILPLK